MSAADINNTIALDLGTSNSCCTVWKGDQAVVLNTNDGNTTPSVVYVTDSDMLYGRTALNKKGKPGCFFEFKRILGLGFNDKLTQEYIRRWPFTVKDVKGDNVPCFVVKMGDEEATFTATELYSVFINYFKEKAEEFLEHSITHIVLTVPAHFNDVQRIQVKAAAESCDLTVLRILNEPTAAALAYSMEESLNKKTILVYDIGGGTFDATILKVDDQYSVLSSKGDIHLGGVDFTHAMEDLIKARIRDFLGNDYEFSKNQETKIAKLAEEKKMELSNDQVVEFYEDDIISGVGNFSISRHQFEEAIAPYLNKAQDILLDALNDAHLAKDDIDAIILIGGTSVIPSIRTRLTDFFAGKPVLQTIDPNTAVSRGAMNYAALYLGVVDLRGVVIPQKEVVPEGLGEQYREYVVSNPHDMEIPLPITESFEHHNELPVPHEPDLPEMPDLPPDLPEPDLPEPDLPPEPLEPSLSVPELPPEPLEPPEMPELPPDLPEPDLPEPDLPEPDLPEPDLPPDVPEPPLPEPEPLMPPSEPVAPQNPITGGIIDEESVTAKSYVLEQPNDTVAMLLPAGTKFLKEKVIGLETAEDYCDEVRIRIAQGESPRYSENDFYCRMTIRGIPRRPKGEVKVRLTIRVNGDGIADFEAETREGLKAEVVKSNPQFPLSSDIFMHRSGIYEMQAGKRKENALALYKKQLATIENEFTHNTNLTVTPEMREWLDGEKAWVANTEAESAEEYTKRQNEIGDVLRRFNITDSRLVLYACVFNKLDYAFTATTYTSPFSIPKKMY